MESVVNQYTYKFWCICPNNKESIKYTLVIKTDKTIMVEDIVNHVLENHSEGYHESIADDLYCSFGGEQYLVANHHGVLIETWRTPNDI